MLVIRSSWDRFVAWIKRPFRLDPSLTINDPDYFTAIYSSNVPQFEELFNTLRGSKDLYFTPSERSLLTYELLSRAQCDHADDDDDESLNKLTPIHRGLSLKRNFSF